MSRHVAPQVPAIVPPNISSEGIDTRSSVGVQKDKMSQRLSCLHRSPHGSPPQATKISWDLVMCRGITHIPGRHRKQAPSRGHRALSLRHTMIYLKVEITGMFAHPYLIPGPKGPRDCSTRSPIA